MEATVRVCVAGALGRMGTRIRDLLPEEPALRLAGALEAPGVRRLGESLAPGVVLVSDPEAALAASDVLIDFTVPAATLALLPSAEKVGIACVIGTTGIDDAGRAAIARAAERLPIVYTPNFSIAVNVLTHLVREAARRLGEGYDAEIVELHHAAKRDAPSGTALRLADAVVEGRGLPAERARERFVRARSGDTGPRPVGSIGLQALRGGDNPGEHTVLFLGSGERLELAHRAMTRDHFVRGALRAAAWVAGRGPGLYGMDEVLGLAAQ
jgi:4-hydroxy-tetrahydrodipicolinate reductase